MRYISSVCSGWTQGSSISCSVPEKASRRYPDVMPEPTQLAPFNTKEQQLPLDVHAPYSISRARVSPATLWRKLFSSACITTQSSWPYKLFFKLQNSSANIPSGLLLLLKSCVALKPIKIAVTWSPVTYTTLVDFSFTSLIRQVRARHCIFAGFLILLLVLRCALFVCVSIHHTNN